jgi:hypothetical protein
VSEDAKLKHLEMIQAVVARMATASFIVKGWAVTLVVGIYTLEGKSLAYLEFASLALIPIVMFWLLDGYFLFQERLYREIYDVVRVKSENDVDFLLSTESRRSWSKSVHAMFAPIQIIFYLVLAGVILAVAKTFR